MVANMAPTSAKFFPVDQAREPSCRPICFAVSIVVILRVSSSEGWLGMRTPGICE